MKDNNPADNPPGASSGASLSPALAVRPMLRRSMLALLLAAFMQGLPLPVFIRSLMRCYGETRRNSLTGLWPSALPLL